MNTIDKKTTFFLAFLVYVSGFLFFLEWFYYPFRSFPMMDHMHVFLLFSFFSYGLTVLNWPWWLKVILNGCAMFVIIQHMFIDIAPFTSEWSELVRQQWYQNWGYITSGHIGELTGDFRTLILLIILWIMCYFVYFLFVRKRRVFIFVGLTFIYVGMLDAFALYDGTIAMIRIFIVGFFVLGLVHFIKLSEDENKGVITLERGFLWVVPLVLLIVASTTIGFFSPKYKAQWTDPIPKISQYIRGDHDGVKKSGYREDDSQLGGSFMFNYTPVFQAKTSNEQYWKVETKDFYTGRGWIKSTYPVYQPFQNNTHDIDDQLNKVMERLTTFEAGELGHLAESIAEILGAYNYEWYELMRLAETTEDDMSELLLDFFMTKSDVDDYTEVDLDDKEIEQLKEIIVSYVQPKKAHITFEDDVTLPKIAYPYGLNDVMTDEGDVIVQERHYDDLLALTNNEYHSLQNYSMEFYDPLVQADGLSNHRHQDVESIRRRYTQLPEELPERVKQLAFDLTEEHKSRYDKAQAIEHYLNGEDFHYETDGIAIPEESQDYVDQFLFETKKGYCDNFSSAMIVMLRSVDIPARWVKGFSSGDVIDYEYVNSVRQNTYEITDANAHSWVEVYFHGEGWIPFEPTKGFTQPLDMEEVQVTQDDETRGDSPLSGPNIPEDLDEDESETVGIRVDEFLQDDEMISAPKRSIYLSISLLVGLSGLVFYMYYQRHRLKTSYIARKWGREQNEKMYEMAYHHLLHMLKRRNIPIEPYMTLREIADNVNKAFGSTDMMTLTLSYEQMIYRGNFIKGEQMKMMKLWQRLIEETMK